MKKILLFVLLGTGVVIANSESFTTSMTDLLVGDTRIEDLDQRLENRLAALDELREKGYPSALVHRASAEKRKSPVNNKINAAKTVSHKLASLAELPYTPNDQLPAAGISNQTEQAKAPVTDLSTVIKPARIKVVRLPYTDITVEDAVAGTQAEVTTVATISIKSEDAYAKIESVETEELKAPVLEFQWSNDQRRLVPVQNPQAKRLTHSADNAPYIKVRPGDTLSKLAARLYGDGSDYSELYKANRDVIKNVEYIYPGQKLRVPKAKVIAKNNAGISGQRVSVKPIDPIAQLLQVTVEEGDTLSKIALRYLGDIKMVKTLYEINSAYIDNPDLIYPGQKIRIPSI